MLINNIGVFRNIANPFLQRMFGEAIVKGRGEIEMRIFPKDRPPAMWFFDSITPAIEKAYELCNSGIDVYVGVNPRVGKGGKKANVHYITTFHAEVDYGTDGHKKKTEYANSDEALEAISKFEIKPTIVNNSSGGFHCFWVLTNPLLVKKFGVEPLETINKNISEEIGGDRGTQDLGRVLRIPGTYNFKLPDNPREVTVIWNNGPSYVFEDFKKFSDPKKPVKKKSSKGTTNTVTPTSNSELLQDLVQPKIDDLEVSDRIKTLILNGNDGSLKWYPCQDQFSSFLSYT